MLDFTILGFSSVAIVLVLTQILKKYMPERFVPILPLIIGIIIVCLASWDFGTDFILKGLLIGLVSMGGYDVLKEPVFGLK